MKLALFKGNRKKGAEHKLTTFSEQLFQAFGQIKTDIDSINSKLDTNQSEMERLGQWIGYLNRHSQRISETNAKILQKHEKIAENHHKLHTSHQELLSSHENTFRLAENLENRHQELSGTISAHAHEIKSDLKSELNGHLQQHREDYEQEIRRLNAWIDYFSTHIDRQKGKEDDMKQDLAKVEKTWLEAYSKLRELVNDIKGENSTLKEDVSDVRSALEQARNELKSTILDVETTKSELSAAKQAMQNTAQELENTRILAESIKDQAKSEGLPPEQPVQAPVQQPQQFIQPVVQQVSPTHSSFQRHIMSRIMPNRKGYVMKFILDLVKENQHSTKEIEEVVVNEKQLCGRTSFYAYLKELKLKGKLAYAEIDERSILVCTDPQQTLGERLDRF